MNGMERMLWTLCARSRLNLIPSNQPSSQHVTNPVRSFSRLSPGQRLKNLFQLGQFFFGRYARHTRELATDLEEHAT